MNESELLVRAFLRRCGIRPHLKGYRALSYALELALDDRTYLDGITKRLYPDVALCLQISPQTVERLMRYAIEQALDVNGTEDMQRALGYAPSWRSGKYSNREFLTEALDAIIAQRDHGEVF